MTAVRAVDPGKVTAEINSDRTKNDQTKKAGTKPAIF